MDASTSPGRVAPQVSGAPDAWAGRSAVGGASVCGLMPPAFSKASQAMASYAQGADVAFELLYDELAPKLHRYLGRFLRHEAAVEDALQQVFLHIHLGRGRFSPGSRVEPWAYAIAHAVAVDQLRRDRVRTTQELPEEHPAESTGADSLVFAGELSAALRNELEQVSPRLREAFLLVRLDGLSHAEAACVLGIEETATKLRTHRATVWLRERLARFGTKGNPE